MKFSTIRPTFVLHLRFDATDYKLSCAAIEFEHAAASGTTSEIV